MDINTRDELEEAIKELKLQKASKKEALTLQLKDTFESLKPANVIKHTISKFVEPGNLRNTALKAVGGIGTALLTKGIIGRRSSSAIGGILGNVLKVGATNAFIKNADKIKAYSSAIYNNVFKKK